jgi:hypothetical protein
MRLFFRILLTTFVIYSNSSLAGSPISTSISPQSLGTQGQVSCVTQMTQMAAANCTNATSGQNYCTASTTNTAGGLEYGLQEMNSPANSGMLCPGTYNASFAGCWMVTGKSCGGGSCGGWGAYLYTGMVDGSAAKKLSSNSSYWVGTGGNSDSNYNPNEGVTFFMSLPPFNGPNVFYHTGTNKNLYFTVTLENDGGNWQDTGSIIYCILSLYLISNNPNVSGTYP